MLQKLRDQTQNTGFKILVGAIIVVLTLFGFGATSLFLGSDPEIAKVGDYSITQNVLAVETERERMRILNRMGPEFDPANIDRQQLSQYVIQQVVNKQVVYQTAAELGLKVPESEVNETLVASPAYQVDGQFNEAIYRQALQLQGFNPVQFLTEYTSALSSEAMQKAITETLAITDWEVGEIVRVINQRRDLAYLSLRVEDYESQVNASDEEVALRYDEEQSAYMTELTLDVEFVALTVDSLIDDPRIEVTAEDIAAQYGEARASALRDEQRDSSHILITSGDQRTSEEAQALIQEVVQRLADGEEFSALASSESEDPASAQTGGSLGAVGKGIFDPVFETALWALESPGDISDPVESAFGYHLIRLDEIVEPEYPSLESQSASLSTSVRRVKAQDLFGDIARELEELSYDEQSSLSQTAEELGLVVEQRLGVTKATDDEKLSTPALSDALFSSEVLEGNNSNAIALGEDELIVLRVNEQYRPELKPLETVSDEIGQTIVREKALALIEQHKAQGLARLEAGESASEIANDIGGEWQVFEAATRAARNAADSELPKAVRTYAFGLPRPPAGEKSVGAVDIAEGAALVTVTRVIQGDLDATLAAEAQEIRRAAENRSARIDFQSLVQAAEKELGVERPAPPVAES